MKKDKEIKMREDWECVECGMAMKHLSVDRKCGKCYLKIKRKERKESMK